MSILAFETNVLMRTFIRGFLPHMKDRGALLPLLTNVLVQCRMGNLLAVALTMHYSPFTFYRSFPFLFSFYVERVLLRVWYRSFWIVYLLSLGFHH